MSDKVLYLKGGGTLGKYGEVNLTIKPAQLVKVLAYLNEKRTEAGLAETEFLRIKVKERREKGKYGDTHYATWELWLPDKDKMDAEKPAPGKPVKKAAPPVDDEDDLPF